MTKKTTLSKQNIMVIRVKVQIVFPWQTSEPQKEPMNRLTSNQNLLSKQNRKACLSVATIHLDDLHSHDSHARGVRS